MTTSLGRSPSPTNTPARPPRVRLAFGAVFWRVMGALMLLFALALAHFVVQRVNPAHWVFFFVFQIPIIAAMAFFLSTLVTILAALAVRLVVRPHVIAWHTPRGDDFGSDFHLDPRERTVAESPARMALGRRAWPGGRLVLTDRRLLFLPHAWDVEPWSAPRARAVVRAVDPPRQFFGLVRGVPPRLEVVADGQAQTFALLDAPAWTGLVAR